MANFKFEYENLAERRQKVAEAEDQGLMMLHDDFDPDWKHGDEPHGEMTFTDTPPPNPQTPPTPRDFAKEIDQLSERVTTLEREA